MEQTRILREVSRGKLLAYNLFNFYEGSFVASLLHLILISLSFTLISIMPTVIVSDLCL